MFRAKVCILAVSNDNYFAMPAGLFLSYSTLYNLLRKQQGQIPWGICPCSHHYKLIVLLERFSGQSIFDCTR